MLILQKGIFQFDRLMCKIEFSFYEPNTIYRYKTILLRCKEK